MQNEVEVLEANHRSAGSSLMTPISVYSIRVASNPRRIRQVTPILGNKPAIVGLESRLGSALVCLRVALSTVSVVEAQSGWDTDCRSLDAQGQLGTLLHRWFPSSRPPQEGISWHARIIVGN